MKQLFIIIFFLNTALLSAQTCQEKEHIDYNYSDIIKEFDSNKTTLSIAYSNLIKNIIREYVSDTSQHYFRQIINNIAFEINIVPNKNAFLDEIHINLLSSSHPNIYVISKVYVDTVKHYLVFKNDVLFEYDNFNITSLYYDEYVLSYQDVNCEYFQKINIYKSNDYLVLENQNNDYNIYNFSLVVYNLSGGLILSKDLFLLSAGKIYIPITPDLASGIYIFNLKSKTCSDSYKINLN